MDFTGERYCPAVRGEIALEHYLRYALAVRLAAGRDVLDCASGEGYGSALLARTARSVIGVDISPEALDHARASYVLPNLSFREGSADALPLEDASVDLVVSFETIEHHDRQAEMLTEFRRVLRPGGLLLLSSPDRAFNEDIEGHNPFHVRELYREELEQLIAASFATWRIYDQKTVFASLVCPQQPQEIVCWQCETLERDILFPASGLIAARYVLVLASTTDAPLPAIPLALMEGAVTDSWTVRAREDGLNSNIAELRRQLQELSQQHAELARQHELLVRQHELLVRQHAELQQHYDSVDRLLSSVLTSRSWKLTAPLRRLAELFRQRD